MSLNTADAGLIFHAGMIYLANDQTVDAYRLLDKALVINPYFDILQAREARHILANQSESLTQQG